MKTYYQASGWVKFYEEDIYEEGCLPHTGGIIDGNEVFKAEHLGALMDTILGFTGADATDIDMDACDEAGRLDISVMEDENGFKATIKQIEAWKAGEIRLWDCIYSFQVERITSERLNLREGVYA